MTATEWKARAQNAFIYALATTALVFATLFILSAILGGEQRELAARVDRNAQVTRAEVRETRELLCALFRGAEDPQIHRAWAVHCGE